MGKDATKEKEKKYGSKLGIDNKKDGLIPSFKMFIYTLLYYSSLGITAAIDKTSDFKTSIT